jgi:hypothetical protein
MSLFGEPAVTPGPEGERPEAPVPARPPTPRYRQPVVVLLAALAVVLVLNVFEVNVLQPDPVRTRLTRPDMPIDLVGPTPEDIALGRIVARGLEETQTDSAAWAHVTQVRVVSNIVVIQVGAKSDGVVERVCKQARRYIYSPNPYGPKLRRLMVFSDPGRLIIGLDGKNDACVASRVDSP